MLVYLSDFFVEDSNGIKVYLGLKPGITDSKASYDRERQNANLRRFKEFFSKEGFFKKIGYKLSELGFKSKEEMKNNIKSSLRSSFESAEFAEVLEARILNNIKNNLKFFPNKQGKEFCKPDFSVVDIFNTVKAYADDINKIKAPFKNTTNNIMQTKQNNLQEEQTVVVKNSKNVDDLLNEFIEFHNLSDKKCDSYMNRHLFFRRNPGAFVDFFRKIKSSDNYLKVQNFILSTTTSPNKSNINIKEIDIKHDIQNT